MCRFRAAEFEQNTARAPCFISAESARSLRRGARGLQCSTMAYSSQALLAMLSLCIEFRAHRIRCASNFEIAK
jgi:hypothetical protein